MKFSVILIFLIYAAVVLAELKFKKSKKWAKHSNKFALKFANDEQQERAFQIFLQTDALINDNNDNIDAGFIMAHNEFSHLSDEELKRFRGLKEKSNRKRGLQGPFQNEGGPVAYYFSASPGLTLKDSIDWVKQGWNTTVRNQGGCGDCWAFSALGSLEFAIWNKTKEKVTLSPQDLTDCASDFGNNGCNGGVVEYALDYIYNQGVSLDSDYPFSSGLSGVEGPCQRESLVGKKTYKLITYAAITPGDDRALMEALNKYGVVSVAIDASSRRFSNYRSGIYSPPKNRICSKNINHAVLLVGYGTYPDGQKFWRIKNSWGQKWGDNGYIDISRDTRNNCGISRQSNFPIY